MTIMIVAKLYSTKFTNYSGILKIISTPGIEGSFLNTMGYLPKILQ